MITTWHTLDEERFATWWARKYPTIILPVLPRTATVKIIGNRFEFDEDGEVMPMLPVTAIDGELIDLVAWRPSSPCDMFLLNGCGIDLNIHAVQNAMAFKKPLHVASNPIEWLMNYSEGSCPLKFCDHLMGVQRVVADDSTYKRIERDIRAAYPVPVRSAA